LSRFGGYYVALVAARGGALVSSAPAKIVSQRDLCERELLAALPEDECIPPAMHKLYKLFQWRKNMMKTASVLLAMAFGPSAFGAEGIKMINQSTVMTAGGFPYVLSQPGSYKLSGNLTMSTTTTGNYRNSNGAYDIAIAINADGVVLDLNGFSIIVTNAISSIGHEFFAIADLAANHNIVIRNGTILLKTTFVPTGRRAVGISMRGASSSVFEDLRVSIMSTPSDILASIVLRTGSSVAIRRNVFAGGMLVVDCTTPTLMVENMFLGFESGGGAFCYRFNNFEIAGDSPPTQP
jgi:hypothetical protein